MAFDLKNILERIEATERAQETTKEATVAAAKPAPTVATDTSEANTKVASEVSDSDVLDALNAAIADQEKRASAPSPADDLMKLAEDMMDREFSSLTKKAEILADTIADGIVRRLQMYEGAMNQAAEKTAAEADIAQSAQSGYAHATELMQKVASDVFDSGYNAAGEVLVRVKCAQLHQAGYDAAQHILDSIANGEE